MLIYLLCWFIVIGSQLILLILTLIRLLLITIIDEFILQEHVKIILLRFMLINHLFVLWDLLVLLNFIVLNRSSFYIKLILFIIIYIRCLVLAKFSIILIRLMNLHSMLLSLTYFYGSYCLLLFWESLLRKLKWIIIDFHLIYWFFLHVNLLILS